MKAYPVYRGSQNLAAHPDLWLKDDKGQPAHYSPDETYYMWDHTQAASSQFLLDDCVNMTKRGHIDSCHLDGCTEVPKATPQEDKDEYWEKKQAVMLDMQSKMNGPVICGANGHVLKGRHDFML